MKNQDIFGIEETKETKDFAMINTAGIHRNLTFVAGQIKVIESRTGEKFTVTSLEFQNQEGQKFEGNFFRPPASVGDCSPYEKDEYINGAKTGIKIPVTALQKFKERNQAYFYHLAQLGMALSGLGWPSVVDTLKKHSSSYEELTEAFFKIYPPNSPKNKAIDIKLVWDNNAQKKSSFLILARAGEYNRAFGTYEAGKASHLSLSVRELRSQMSRAFMPGATDIPKETIAKEEVTQGQFTADSIAESIDGLF